MAKKQGANYTTVACNTASLLLQGSVIEKFQEITENNDPIVQIINRSALALYEMGKPVINPKTGKKEIHLVVLATPFVTKNETYKTALHAIHNKKYASSDNKSDPKLVIHTLGPETWVHNMETGVDDTKQAKQVAADIDVMMSGIPKEAHSSMHAFGLYCTHYPSVKPYIIAALSKYSAHFENEALYISQGEIFAEKLLKDITTAIAEANIPQREIPLTPAEASQYFTGQVVSLSTKDNRSSTEGIINRLQLDRFVETYKLYDKK